MEKYIYINYAHEDGAQVMDAIREIQSMGINVHYGNGSEENVSGSQCVVHFCTASSHTSKSYRKIMNYTLKHELDSILIHFDGHQITSDVETQLDVLHTLFKYYYKSAEPVMEMQPEAITEEQQDEVAVVVLGEQPVASVEVLQPAAVVPEESVLTSESVEPAEVQKEAEPVATVLEEAVLPSEPVEVSEVQPVAAVAVEAAPATKPQKAAATTRDELYEAAVRLIEDEGADMKLGFEYLKRAASQGHVEAQYQLSVCYDRGLGVRKNNVEAANWRQMAAYGGHVQAQTETGYCYESGQGVARNFTEAVRWYEMASSQGDIQAKNNLAYCYQKGRGVAKDVAKAIQLYHEAAAGGHASAQYNLAYCYWYGEGVKPDKAKAIELYEQSAINGNAKAAQMLKILKQHAFMSR